MRQTGIVTASSLRLRKTPGGDITGSLPRDSSVEILGEDGQWLHVQANGQEGFVSSQYIREERVEEEAPVAPAPAPIPAPLALPEGFQINGSDVIGPAGQRFARTRRLGVYDYGRTTIGDFVGANPARFGAVSASLLHVMEAVSENEGRLEAINTWDTAFLTFGCFQWTVGTREARGELPSVIDRLKRTDPAVFEQYWGRFGLDVEGVRSPPASPANGFFTLDGEVLDTIAKKSRLRTVEWAYRFHLAGGDDTVRQVQIEHAMSRLDLFYRNSRRKIRDRFVADYVSSEYGVALLLDQHVNRPGHVPGTLAEAVDALANEVRVDNPQEWTDEEEHKLLSRYLTLRHETSMTDSAKRANRTKQAVASGLASDQRGSFQV